MTTQRRAIVICRPGSDSRGVECLSHVHSLRVVYTVYTDAGPELAARIAVQHVLDHVAEVVVIPYLTDREFRENPAWQMVTWVADLVIAIGGCAGS